MITYVFLLITIAFIVLSERTKWGGMDRICSSLGFISFTIFVFLLFCHIAVQFNTATYATEREALQQTYEQSRELNEFERATVTKDIAEFNKQLAIDKYWNSTWMFGWWINDDVDNIEPIR